MSPSTSEAKKRVRSILTYVPLRMRAARATSQASTAKIDNFRLEVPPGVFHPRFFYSSRILAKELRRLDLRGKRVLDMGTGTGILGLVAARQGATVLAVDVNPEAVKAATANASLNHMADHISVQLSNLFDGLGSERFDLIVWNPPFYPRPAEDLARAAWDGGDSYDVIRRFAASAEEHLQPAGTCLLILSGDMNIPFIVDMFSRYFLYSSAVKTHRRLLESFEVHSFSPQVRP